MPLEPLSAPAFAFIAQVDEYYAALMRSAQPDPHLGGRLFYAGELTDRARAAIVAANIAGAASLAASALADTAKQAMRAGQVDFLVNSLDEALRILKNEIRKHETVAVCVTAAPDSIEQEMRDRGVQPDLLFCGHAIESAHGSNSRSTHGSRHGSRRGAEAVVPDSIFDSIAGGKAEQIWLTWRASQSPALWLPRLDALALALLTSEASHTRRWLERAPRYLGRIAQKTRVLRVSDSFASHFIHQAGELVRSGEIPVPIEIEIGLWGQSRQQSIVPNP
jgi:urocanate hydratase